MFFENTEGLLRSKADIRAIAETVCGVPLEEKSCLEEKGILELWERSTLRVDAAVRTERAVGEEQYCGDTADTFLAEDNRLFALISDGMGAGMEASQTSGVGALLLKTLLRVGGGCEESLRLLNGFLRNRGSGSLHECSATVDLMELDLIEGRASFYKSGAAPTYVFREGGLVKLRSRTVPIGIMREPDIKRISFEIGAGDLGQWEVAYRIAPVVDAATDSGVIGGGHLALFQLQVTLCPRGERQIAGENVPAFVELIA